MAGRQRRPSEGRPSKYYFDGTQGWGPHGLSARHDLSMDASLRWHDGK